MKPTLLALAVLFAGSASGAEPVIDNEHVTVWDTSVPLPPAAHEFIVVPLAAPGTAHFGNPGDTPGQEGTRTIVIELKDHAAVPFRNSSGLPNAFPRPHALKLLENERVVVWSYRWIAGEPTPMHIHDKDAVIVYEQDSALLSTTPDGKKVINSYKSGQVRFNPRGGVHSELLASFGASAVITELK
jgi:hypothetical protein